MHLKKREHFDQLKNVKGFDMKSRENLFFRFIILVRPVFLVLNEI